MEIDKFEIMSGKKDDEYVRSIVVPTSSSSSKGSDMRMGKEEEEERDTRTK